MKVWIVSFDAGHFSLYLTDKVESQLPGETYFVTAAVADDHERPVP